MNPYIDAFVLSVPKANLEQYKAAATIAATVWKEHGALEYRECLGDDLDVQDQVPFPKFAGTQSDEVVIFAYAVFPSREARDQINQKIMSDPRITKMCTEVKSIFDCSRMAYGGFQSFIHQ